MELGELLYNKSEYIETASGNKVSRQSVLCGSQNIVLNGKTIIMNDCIIRGDLANVRVGRHCVVKSRSVIRPPFKNSAKVLHSFLCILGIMSLLRKTVWSTLPRLVLMFTLGRTV